jgi:hypothetical protein
MGEEKDYPKICYEDAAKAGLPKDRRYDCFCRAYGPRLPIGKLGGILGRMALNWYRSRTLKLEEEFWPTRGFAGAAT